METTAVPDCKGLLTFDPCLMSVDSPEGLWLCTDLEDVLAIGINAAALAPGVGPDRLGECRDFFEAFAFVLVVGADPERRKTLAEQLREALPSLEICVTEQAVYRDCRSVRELRDRHGLSAVNALPEQQTELPPWGILPAWTVEAEDLAQTPHLPSGIPALDSLIGGFYGGEVTVWTGRRGEGKSTALALPTLAALRSGAKVFAYSGELSAARYMDWLRTIAAGPEHLALQMTDTGRQVWCARREVAAQIDLWLRNRLYIADNQQPELHREDRLLAVFWYAWKRYGCSVFLLDNLMTVELKGEDFFRAQSRFVGKLVEFAHKTGAHVHLVAHLRKGGGPGRRDGDDISGSADIANRADNTICVSRENITCPFQAELRVLKNRDFGETGAVRLKFDTRSRRFYQENPNWKCGWEE